MPKTDLKLYSTDATTGAKQTTSITYVNPNASNTVLKQFAQKLNNLTTNTYSSADRVETVNVDTEGSRKSFRDITITGAAQGATATISANVTTSGTINPAVFYYTNDGVQLLTTTSIASEDPTIAKCTVVIPNTSGTIFVGLTSGTSFYADFVSTQVS